MRLFKREIYFCDWARRREVAYMGIWLTDLYASRGPSCVLRAKRAAAPLNACWPVLFLLPDVSLRRRMRPSGLAPVTATDHCARP